jgi:hypothetical protein
MNYQLSRRVAADLFEGEYIIANLDTGLYYSLQGAGIYLLNNLPCVHPDQVIEKFAAAFSDQKEQIEQDLKSIWNQLENEMIVVPTDGGQVKSDLEIPLNYEPSSFNRYADMQDLLALDPIHEVDEEGWEKKGENESK